MRRRWRDPWPWNLPEPLFAAPELTVVPVDWTKGMTVPPLEAWYVEVGTGRVVRIEPLRCDRDLGDECSCRRCR